ncbi:MAG: SCO family protein [Deltaproteobacteria bacterium]|nr:SCO family protein [Deltaproteobacteria bacterium]
MPSDAATPIRVPGRRLLLALLVIFLVAVVPSIIVPTLMCRPEPPALQDLGDVPAFELVDAQGLPFTEEGLRGHPTIINFIFTRCDTICPVISMKMQRVEDKTRDKRGVSIKMLSITVDPEHDTAERLAGFAARYKANPDRWKFLTGPADQVRSLVEGTFMNSTLHEGTTRSGAPNIAHSGYFLLVDSELKIRGAYDSTDVQRLDQLMRDARYLARTSRSGFKFGGT